MPKDNEVDEKVIWPERIINMPCPDGTTDRIVGFRIPEGHPALGKYGLSEGTQWLQRVTLGSAATVAELRAEVESERKLRLRAEGLCSQWITRHDFALESLNELTADRNAQRDRADAAERRVGELEAALRPLADATFAEFCDESTEEMEPDDSKVRYPEDTCEITFGMIRSAQKALRQEKPE